MKICVITSSFPANPSDAAAAAGLFVKDFCLTLAELGHAVTVITPDKTEPAKEAWANLDVRWFPWAGGEKPLSTMKPYHPRDALAMVSLFRRGMGEARAVAESQGIDHTLAMWAAPAGILAMGLKRRYGVPYTTWCLGADIWTYGRYPVLRGVIRRVVRGSDFVYADGLQLARDVEALCGRGCPFLPSSRRLNRALIRRVEVAGEGPNFLFIGRYHPVKGVDVLLEAMARYHGEGHGGHLYLFGGGPSGEAIRERASREDLRDCVTVGGFADEGTFVSYLNACDVFLIPSRMESIPVALSDAAQMGRPVIVSDVGDMGRLVGETGAGMVVPSEDSGALCDAMIALADDGARARLGPGIEALAGRFDMMNTAREWLSAIVAREPGGERKEPSDEG